MNKEDLIKELESMLKPVETYNYYCWSEKTSLITSVYQVNPEPDGKIPCPKIECKLAEKMGCGRRLLAIPTEEFEDKFLNDCLKRVITAIKERVE